MSLRVLGQIVRVTAGALRPAYPVDRMVSLGGRCEVAYQLRRIGATDRAYPFDWWITPLAAVPRFLESGCVAAFAAEQLHKVPDYGGRAGLYSHYAGTVHLHEFDHGEDGLALPTPDIATRLQEKYAALHRRLLEDVATGRTLFVRQHLEGSDPTSAAELEPQIDALDQALSGLTDDYLLLLVNYCAVTARPRLLQASVPATTTNGLGSNWRWSAMLRAQGLSCRRGARAGSHDLFRTLPGSRRRAGI